MNKISSYNEKIKLIIERESKEYEKYGEISPFPYSEKDRNKCDYVVENDKINALIYKDDLVGINILAANVFKYNDEIGSVIVNYAKENDINFIEYDHYYCDSFSNLPPINLESTIDKCGDGTSLSYNFQCNSYTIATIDEKHKNDIRDAFEKQYYIDDISNFKIELMDRNTAKQNIEIVVDGHGHNPVFPGMHYFSPCDYAEKNDNYVIAHKDNHVLGAIMLHKDEKEQWISYIDVAKPYKNKGIATAMIKELNKYLDKNKPLQLSQMSGEGKKYNIANVFERNIHVTDVKRSQIDIDLDRLIESKKNYKAESRKSKDKEIEER